MELEVVGGSHMGKRDLKLPLQTDLRNWIQILTVRLLVLVLMKMIPVHLC